MPGETSQPCPASAGACFVAPKPILAITMGDPAGIGPEIIAKALPQRRVHEVCQPLVVGDAGVMRRVVEMLRAPLEVRPVSAVGDARFAPGTMDVLDLGNVDLAGLVHGKVSAECGEAAFQAIRKVIDLAMAKEVDGTVTAPINKESLNLAGHHFAGHTEIYAHFTNTTDYVMLLTEGDLRVAHVSTHVSLRDACDLARRDRILKVIRLAHDACVSLGIPSPSIGVAGLNPHSGEAGLFGTEEREEILPAIQDAKADGLNVDGPIPPDTLFPKLKGGLYDIIVVMYHDQGHVAMKFNSFKLDRETKEWKSVTGVNTTLGLPIIRTSVDHGTAFDQAGKGTAREDSLLDAIEFAAKLANGH